MTELQEVAEPSSCSTAATKVNSDGCDAKTVKRKNFRWEATMIDHLIDCLLNYKSNMLYKSLDFEADKPIQYKELRIAMTAIYEQDISLFGPITQTPLPSNFEELSKEDKATAKHRQKTSKELIDKGTKRIVEKVKEIRQSFAKAVVSGNRSGSGKIVYEFYDKLVLIWGGSANTEPLPYGVTADNILEDNNKRDFYDDSLGEIIEQEEQLPAGECDQVDDYDSATHTAETPSATKRKGSCVPQLIDNKRKHLERNLSAAQRDQLLIKEANEDSRFKKELAEVMRDSSTKFSESVKAISQSITDLGAGKSRSIEILSGAIMHQARQLPVNQNLFYQQHQDYPIQNVPHVLREETFPSLYNQPRAQHEESHVLPPKYI